MLLTYLSLSTQIHPSNPRPRGHQPHQTSRPAYRGSKIKTANIAPSHASNAPCQATNYWEPQLGRLSSGGSRGERQRQQFEHGCTIFRVSFLGKQPNRESRKVNKNVACTLLQIMYGETWQHQIVWQIHSGRDRRQVRSPTATGAPVSTASPN